MSNKIPRAATKLKVTNLISSNMGTAGISYIATKDSEGRWTAEYNNKTWALFVSHLRNGNISRIEVL